MLSDDLFLHQNVFLRTASHRINVTLFCSCEACVQVVLIVLIFEGSGKFPDPGQGVDPAVCPNKPCLLVANCNCNCSGRDNKSELQ